MFVKSCENPFEAWIKFVDDDFDCKEQYDRYDFADDQLDDGIHFTVSAMNITKISDKIIPIVFEQLVSTSLIIS